MIADNHVCVIITIDCTHSTLLIITIDNGNTVCACVGYISLLILKIVVPHYYYLCTAILGNVMLAITRSFHFFYPAVCAHVHSITCYHLKLFTLIICTSHCTVQICITNKLHDYIAWSHLMLFC